MSEPSAAELAARILEILNDAGRPLSAREIAERLAAAGHSGLTKREINSCLYGAHLKERVSQDKRYRWSAGGRSRTRTRTAAPGKEEPATVRTSAAWARFDAYASYYLDCIQEDEGGGVREFLTDEGNKFLTLPLEREWHLEDSQALSLELPGQYGRFAAQLRQRGQGATLFYGYPLYVQWLASTRSGWTGGFAVPVFLLPVEYGREGDRLELRLSSDWPRLNPEFARLALSSKEEQRAFLDELGLLEADGEPPEDGLADVVLRLREIGPPASAVETLEPNDLQLDPSTAHLDREGLYNRALLCIGERSKFTQGLEHELRDLKSTVRERELERSALRVFFNTESHGDRPESATSEEEPKDDNLVEVVGLNDEQRQAIRSALCEPLTVVTGPPGTGKSQVVTTLLANAYLQGQRVLFTSRNNKAVDVVETRTNGLSGLPIAIRTGRRSGDRNLQSELLDFLGQALSLSASQEDRQARDEAEGEHKRLQERRARLWATLETLRQTRNRVDTLDEELESARTGPDADMWPALSEYAAAPEIPEGQPAAAVERLDHHLRSDLGIGARLLRWIRRRQDFARIVRASEAFQGLSGFPARPPRGLEVPTLEEWREWFRQVARRLEIVHRVVAYKTALEELKQLPGPEELAAELFDTEERLWDSGARYVAAHGKLLCDRLQDPDLRRALGEYRATLERLSGDRLGGKAYARLRKEQERLFSTVSRALPVWCVTNLSARSHLPFDSALFDLAIIDEASQCDIPSALPIFFRAKRAVVIGDPNQLRHITKIDRQRDQQIQARYELTSAADQPYAYSYNSLFDLAATCAGAGKVQFLREHFRSHAQIVEFSNRQWYGGSLHVCTDYRRLNRPSEGPGVKWTHVEGKTNRPGRGGAVNQAEADAVVAELERLLHHAGFEGSVGVVSPFRAQANRIRDLASDRLDIRLLEGADLIVDTAHGFQGDERDVILLSPCLSREIPRGARYFLSSTGNLFNVAITRARALLHVVGDHSAAAESGIPHVEAFARYVASLENEEPSYGETPWDDPRVGHWEKPFFDALVDAGLRPLPQYVEHQYRLDFAILLPGLKLDIEVDGELYHKEWDGSRARRDVLRDLRLSALGWTIKRFWVYRLRDELDACVQEVVDVIEDHRR